ncbi:MAG: 50S ribosomal protein L30 [Rhodothermales bacterium]|nr:50S ribosomal protein L30 [Rhodothermales bacterium]
MGKLKITQVKSVIRQTKRQKATIEALGIRRMHHTVLHNDTPQIRGMVDRVSHLVEVVEEDSTAEESK